VCTFEMGVAGGEMGGGGQGGACFLFPTGGYLGHIQKKAEKIENGGENLRAKFFTLFSEKVKGEHFSTCYYFSSFL
jgi:hypothetical protein